MNGLSSATLQAKCNTSPAKHPVDYNRVCKRILLGCHQASLLLKTSPSLKRVQKQQQHEDRTISSADPVKDEAPAFKKITGQSTCIWISLRHYTKEATWQQHPQQFPQGRLKRQHATGYNPKQPTTNNKTLSCA